MVLADSFGQLNTIKEPAPLDGAMPEEQEAFYEKYHDKVVRQFKRQYSPVSFPEFSLSLPCSK